MTYPTTANLKTFLKITSASDDAVLDYALDAAIEFVERQTGRVFVVVADKIELFPVQAPHVLPSNNLKLLFLRDLAAAPTTVTNGDGVAVTSSEYLLLSPYHVAPYFGIELYRNTSGVYWQHGGDYTNISIDAKWGYSEDCPDVIFQVILQIAQHDYQARSTGQGGAVAAASRRGGLVIPPSGLPDDVLERLHLYRR